METVKTKADPVEKYLSKFQEADYRLMEAKHDYQTAQGELFAAVIRERAFEFLKLDIGAIKRARFRR